MAKGTHCHLCNPLSPASSHRRSAPPHPAGSPWPSARAGGRVPSLCSTLRAKLSRLRLAFHFLSLWVNHVDSDRNQMFPCVVQNCVAHEVPLHVVFTTAATSTVVRRKTSKHCEETANVASRPCVTTRLMTHSGSPIAATEHTVPSSVRPRAGMGGAGGGCRWRWHWGRDLSAIAPGSCSNLLFVFYIHSHLVCVAWHPIGHQVLTVPPSKCIWNPTTPGHLLCHLPAPCHSQLASGMLL